MEQVSNVSSSKTARAALVATVIVCIVGSFVLGRRDGLRRVASQRVAPQTVASPPGEPPVGSAGELNAALESLKEAGGIVLPKRLYVVPGRAAGLYLRGIVPVKDPEVFSYSLNGTCGFAALERRRVALNPPLDARGTCRLGLTVASPGARAVAQRDMDVVLVDPRAGAGRSFQMLLVGDSLGHASHFPNELARLLRAPGNPAVTFVGSFRPPGSIVPHEQYGGWRFVYFYSVFGQDPKSYHRDRSPFVFDDGSGKPVFDVSRYLAETLKGAVPRNVHVQLGINDAFSLDPDSPELPGRLDEILGHADILIAGLRKALPKAVITVGSVIQANASDRAFVESYPRNPELHSEWRWRRVQLRLASRMLEHFDGDGPSSVLLVPTHAVVDPLDGYSAHPWPQEGFDVLIGSAVHPSSVGDTQLATALFAAVKAELGGLTP